MGGENLSNVTHKPMSCIYPVGKTVMEVQIQNLSFESYVLSTKDPEPDNLFKPKLSCTPCETLLKVKDCAVLQSKNQLPPICSSQDCPQKQSDVKHYSKSQSAANNISVRTMVFWNSKFKKLPTQKAQHRRVAGTY